MYKYKKERYLSKNNQNIKRVELINSIFSKSKILIPFREPIQHAYSLLTQHKKFIEDSKNDKFISKYMKWIGHTEFGPNYIPVHNENIKFHNSLEELINNVDGLVISSPANTHFEIAKKALEKIDVLIEKPIAMKTSDVINLQELEQKYENLILKLITL